MNFLVQKINNRIVHDFAFVLTQAKEYLDWRKEKISIRYLNDINLMGTTVRNPDRYIPVGSVEFVSCYLKSFYPDAIHALKPLNVPEALFPYAGREIINVNGPSDIERLPHGPLYWKSNRKIKHFINGPVPPEADAAQFYGMQVSQLIDIESEWRVFVFHGEIKHLANYSGNCTIFPSVERIKEMIKCYQSAGAPIAYTIDVGITSDEKTVVIECHRFFSCGLYGFNDYSVIPYMFSQEWHEMKNINNKAL